MSRGSLRSPDFEWRPSCVPLNGKRRFTQTKQKDHSTSPVLCVIPRGGAKDLESVFLCGLRGLWVRNRSFLRIPYAHEDEWRTDLARASTCRAPCETPLSPWQPDQSTGSALTDTLSCLAQRERSESGLVIRARRPYLVFGIYSVKT
jgi:hypothetical protein